MTYTERVEKAAQSFLKLADEYLDPKDPETCPLRNFIASEYQVETLDLDVKVWEIKNK